MRRLASTTVVVMVLATAGVAAAGPRVLFAPVYGESDLADEAAAVHLLVRSAFLASDPAAIGDVTGAPTLDSAAQALTDADADQLVLIEVDRLGPTLVATAQIVDRTGAVVGKVASQASDGGVVELATELAKEIGTTTGLTVTDPPELSIGQIRPYARAFELAAAGKRDDAARALAGADPVIALRVVAAGQIASALWQDTKLDPAARLIACTVACTPKQVVGLTEGDASAAARTARALAAVGLSDAAAAALELAGMPAAQAGDVAYARAAIAQLRQDRKARDAAVADLVNAWSSGADAGAPGHGSGGSGSAVAGAPDRAAIAWVAKLPSGVLPPAIEVAAVGAGEKVGDRRIAAMIGLRAAEANVAIDRALALISVVELDRSERGRLEVAIEKATGPDAMRLVAELAIGRGDVAGAKAALAKLKRSTDPRAALYRGRIAWMVGDLDTAADELAAAHATSEQARVMLAKGDVTGAAKAAGTAESSRLARVAGAELALADARPADAVAQLRAAEKLAPGNRDTQARLANALELAGDPAGAKAVRARMLALAEPAAPKQAVEVALGDGSGAGSGSGSGSDLTEVALSAAHAKVRASIKDLLAAFPPATLATTSLVFAPIGEEPSGWALKDIDPAPLLHELEVVLDTTYQSHVLARSAQRFADKPSGPDLAALATAHGAGTVMLYAVDTDGAVRLVVFDAASNVAFEQRGSIDVAALGMVHWNVRWLAIPIGLIAVLVGLGLVILVRGWGVIEVKVKRDPNGKDEVLCVELQRTKRRWKIRDLDAFRAATTAAGAKVGRRTARLIGDLTRFRVPPGHWFVHLYGVYDRPGGTRMLDEQHTSEVQLERNKSELIEIDLVPRTTELRIKVYDDEKVVGVVVWLDDGPKLYTDAKGECVMYAPMGEHTLHVETKGIKLDRELSFKTPLVEAIEINLTRERRLAEVSGGLSLQKRAVSQALPSMRAEAELDLPAEQPLDLPPPGSAPAPASEPPAEQGGGPRRNKPVSIAKLAAAATMPSVARDGTAGASDAMSERSGVLAGGLGPTPPALPEQIAAGSVVPPAATALIPAGVIPVAGPGTAAAPPDLLCGRYRIKKLLGKGAMGVVYRARDEHLEREVAVKVLASELRHHPDALRFFTEEAKALAQLNHPNIVSVYDQPTDGDQTYLIMEFVDGRTLDSLLEEKVKVPVHTALALIDQLCTGLAYAHARRVIHRDIKPANIFVSRDRVVKLGDFGLARVMRELSIRKTEIRGTPLYMAPEQITGENVTHRSDLYAVGCTLFELVTGRPPFTDGEILYHHLHTEPPKPSDFEPTLSAAFDQLVLDCIAKDADARIESATAIRDRLRGLGTQAPAPAPPVKVAAGGS